VVPGGKMIFTQRRIYFLAAILIVALCSPVLADDKSQVTEIESKLRSIDLPVKNLNNKITATIDKMCPNTSDTKCLKKYSNRFSKMYDRAYEENLKAVNKCYDLTQEVKRKKFSDSTKKSLVDAIGALSLRYGYFEDAASFAQEAFDQLGANNIKGFVDNMDKFSERSIKVKSEHTRAMSILSELNARLGLTPVQK
jgi:DNA repair ATPase RecN